MSFKNFQETMTFKAESDLTGDQFKIVELTSTAHGVELGAAREGFGVLQNHPKDNEAATVALSGVTKVIVGAAVSVGNFLTSAATGFAIKTISGDATARRVFGRALTAAASGSIATMLIDRQLVSSGGAL